MKTTWDVTGHRYPDGTRLEEEVTFAKLLAEGWEPFAVTREEPCPSSPRATGETVWLRRVRVDVTKDHVVDVVRE